MFKVQKKVHDLMLALYVLDLSLKRPHYQVENESKEIKKQKLKKTLKKCLSCSGRNTLSCILKVDTVI